MIESVSIVMPAFRATGTIRTAIQSLLDQQDPPAFYEIIIVDDASPDDTPEIAESFVEAAAEKGITLRVLRLEKNGGPARARNAGAKDAKGEVVVFTDSDCELTPIWLAQMLAGFDDPEIAAVKGAYLTRQRELGARFAQAEFEERYKMLEEADEVDVVFSYSAAFRRDVFEQLEGYDTRFPVADNEDTDLSWRLIEAGHKAAFRPQAKLYHRHPPRLYDYYRKKISRGYWRMVVYRRFPDKAVKDSYTPQSLKLQILLAYLSVLLLLLSPFIGLGLLGLCLLVFVLTSVPFMRLTWKNDPLIAVLSPVLLFGRALSLGAGVIKWLPDAFKPNPLAN